MYIIANTCTCNAKVHLLSILLHFTLSIHVYVAVLLDWHLVHSSCLLNIRRFLMNCCMSAIDLMQSL